MIQLLKWFLYRRWQFILYMNDLLSRGYHPGRELNTLTVLHNNNVAGCREHPVIYNDMCCIVRGGK